MAALTEAHGPVVALWATNIGRRLRRLEDWVDAVDRKLAAAAEAGADLLVMPEYACAQWLSTLSEKLRPTDEVRWMAEQASSLLEAVRPAVEARRVGLLAGSMPVPKEGGFTNTAVVLLPGGREVRQDKLTLTPDERDAGCWTLSPGDTLRLFEWRGLRWVVVICLDVEQPALAARLAALEPDVVLVPAMTSSLAGHHRVFDCAKARAVELFASVLAVGTIGDCTAFSHGADYNVSGAACFVPCEPALGHTGTWGIPLPPRGDATDDGPVWISPPLPTALLREMKTTGTASVWRGAWSADNLSIREDGA